MQLAPPSRPTGAMALGKRAEVVDDGVEHRLELRTEGRQRNDNAHRDQDDDQGVLHHALPVLVEMGGRTWDAVDRRRTGGSHKKPVVLGKYEGVIWKTSTQAELIGASDSPQPEPGPRASCLNTGTASIFSCSRCSQMMPGGRRALARAIVSAGVNTRSTRESRCVC